MTKLGNALEAVVEDRNGGTGKFTFSRDVEIFYGGKSDAITLRGSGLEELGELLPGRVMELGYQHAGGAGPRAHEFKGKKGRATYRHGEVVIRGARVFAFIDD